MTNKQPVLTFKKRVSNEPLPYDLLLLADPSKEMINTYINESEVYFALHNEDVIGVLVMQSLTTDTVEIKNVAVKPELQRRGVGSYLIKNVIEISRQNNQKEIFIGTANSSSEQLSLYQKLGFEISSVKKNYFTENYSEAIYENGIQAKHQLILKMEL